MVDDMLYDLSRNPVHVRKCGMSRVFAGFLKLANGPFYLCRAQFWVSVNIWPEVMPLCALFKGMPYSAQQRLGKVLPHELEAEGQSVTVLPARQGYGRSAAEVVGDRESTPIGIVQ